MAGSKRAEVAQDRGMIRRHWTLDLALGHGRMSTEDMRVAGGTWKATRKIQHKDSLKAIRLVPYSPPMWVKKVDLA